jgi:hypothetical protein
MECLEEVQRRDAQLTDVVNLFAGEVELIAQNGSHRDAVTAQLIHDLTGEVALVRHVLKSVGDTVEVGRSRAARCRQRVDQGLKSVVDRIGADPEGLHADVHVPERQRGILERERAELCEVEQRFEFCIHASDLPSDRSERDTGRVHRVVEFPTPLHRNGTSRQEAEGHTVRQAAHREQRLIHEEAAAARGHHGEACLFSGDAQTLYASGGGGVRGDELLLANDA